MINLFYIYQFKCPIEKKVIYIGRTNNISRRIKSHTQHILNNKYIRHPFKCKLQSLYNTHNVSFETLINSFEVVKILNSLEESIEVEYHYINNVYGINNLLNICEDTKFGGDTFTNHPDKEIIRNKLKGKTPWNKGIKYDIHLRNKIKSNTQFNSDPRIKYVLTSPNGDTYEIIGQSNLKEFCDNWKKSHNVKSVKDINWLSPTSFKVEGKGNSKLKGWSVTKILLN